MKRLDLRYAGTCVGCEVVLDAGTAAWWDREAKAVTCLACHDAPPPTDEATPAVAPVDAAAVDRGVPGASARREGQRRAARREERVRAKHPRLGGLMLAVSDDPTSTKVWAQGAVGEERVGAVLEAAVERGVLPLHDRRMPRSRANIDHLAVAPSGVWVVDPKRYLSGKLERRDVGGWFRTDHRLYVGGRDRTKLVDGVETQVAAVAAALADLGHPDVPVHGALCFVDTPLGWFAKPFSLREVRVTWGRELLGPMLAPEVVDAATRQALLLALATRFPPA